MSLLLDGWFVPLKEGARVFGGERREGEDGVFEGDVFFRD